MPRKKSQHRARRGRRGGLASLSIEQLQAEMSRRRDALLQRRADVESELNAIDADLAHFGGSTNGAPRRRGPGRPPGRGRSASKGRRGPKPGRGRGGNEQSLPALLHSLLQGKTMSVPEMAEAARKAGHKSKSKNFRTIVSLAMINHRNMFRRVSRGQYTAK